MKLSRGGPVPHGPEIVACSVCVGAEAWPAARADLEPQQIGLVPEHNQLWIRRARLARGKDLRDRGGSGRSL